MANAELEEFRNQMNVLKKENVDKNDALDVATAQINSLEETNKAYEVRINKYGTTLRRLIKEKKESNFGVKPSDKEKE